MRSLLLIEAPKWSGQRALTGGPHVQGLILLLTSPCSAPGFQFWAFRFVDMCPGALGSV